VEAAQQQAVPTSGAESKTQISDFLAAKAMDQTQQAAILDKLVTADVGSTQSPAPDTETVQPVETPQRADEELLQRLSQEARTAAVESDQARSAPQEEAPLEADKARKDILDSLTKPIDGSADENGKAAQDQEDAGDA
jgi:hypothetical protein